MLGQRQMLEEFDNGLMGAKEGEARDIKFTFPDDYGSEEVAGKKVEFVVTVKAVERPELPDLDDNFAETLGITEGGIDKMKAEIESNLTRELESRKRVVVRDRVMDALYECNAIEAPKALVEEEIDRSVEAVTEQLTSQGLPTDKIDRSVYADDARRRVVLGLVARDIVEKSEIKPDQEAIRARVVDMADSYEDSEAYVNWHMADSERVKNIEAVVIEEQIVEKMLETATVKDEKLSFKDFMNPQQADS
jgi:trigger factor